MDGLEEKARLDHFWGFNKTISSTHTVKLINCHATYSQLYETKACGHYNHPMLDAANKMNFTNTQQKV